jgi:hypothetical protein
MSPFYRSSEDSSYNDPLLVLVPILVGLVAAVVANIRRPQSQFWPTFGMAAVFSFVAYALAWGLQIFLFLFAALFGGLFTLLGLVDEDGIGALLGSFYHWSGIVLTAVLQLAVIWSYAKDGGE